MQLSDSLEVAIGLSFMFFLTSLVLTSVHEVIEMITKARGAYLFDGVKELLNGRSSQEIEETAEQIEATAKEIYTHPLIQGLMRGTVAAPDFMRRLPSYVPTRSFALALLDKAAKGDLHAGDASPMPPSALPEIQQLRMTVEGITNPQLRDALIQAIRTAGGEMDKVQDNVEHWFDSAMDRVSGWYKRRSQWIIFGLGLTTALLLNVNTVVIGQSLAGSMSLRQALVTHIQQRGAACGTDQDCTKATPSEAVDELDSANMPIGWTDAGWSAIKAETGAGYFNIAQDSMSKTGRKLFGWIEVFTGYFLTAFAVTLGAPFWFDTLNRLMVVRATVKPTQKSKDEASQDPQPPAAAGPAVVVNTAQQNTPPPPPRSLPPIDTMIYVNVPEPADRLYEDDDGSPVAGVKPSDAGDEQ